MNQAKIINVLLWAVTALVAAMFLLSGIPKLFDPGWIDRFARWGYSIWFLYLIAALETLGAIALLIPKTACYAAIGLIIIMLGAMYTHLTHDEGDKIIWNLLYAVLLGFITVHRWQQRLT